MYVYLLYCNAQSYNCILIFIKLKTNTWNIGKKIDDVDVIIKFRLQIYLIYRKYVVCSMWRLRGSYDRLLMWRKNVFSTIKKIRINEIYCKLHTLCDNDMSFKISGKKSTNTTNYDVFKQMEKFSSVYKTYVTFKWIDKDILYKCNLWYECISRIKIFLIVFCMHVC